MDALTLTFVNAGVILDIKIAFVLILFWVIKLNIRIYLTATLTDGDISKP